MAEGGCGGFSSSSVCPQGASNGLGESRGKCLTEANTRPHRPCNGWPNNDPAGQSFAPATPICATSCLAPPSALASPFFEAAKSGPVPSASILELALPAGLVSIPPQLSQASGGAIIRAMHPTTNAERYGVRNSVPYDDDIPKKRKFELPHFADLRQLRRCQLIALFFSPSP